MNLTAYYYLIETNMDTIENTPEQMTLLWLGTDILENILALLPPAACLAVAHTCLDMSYIARPYYANVPLIKMMKWSIRSGDINVAQWLLSIGGEFPHNACGLAANLETMKWLKSVNHPWSNTCANILTEFGTIEMLEWAISNGCPHSQDIVYAAATTGCIQRLEFVRGYGYKFDCYALTAAINRGYVLMIDHMLANGCEHNNTYGVVAASLGRVDILDILFRHGVQIPGESTLPAAQNGHLPAVKWLLARGIRPGFNLCEYAARSNSIEMMSYLLSVGYRLTPNVFKNAVQCHSSIEFLEYLYQRDCPVDDLVTMLAASSGVSNVIKWVYEKDFPDRNTMITYVTNNMEAVQWLYERDHKILHSVYSIAINNRDIQKIRWLLSIGIEYDIDVIKHDILFILFAGDLEIAKVFAANGVKFDEAMCMSAVKSGRHNFAMWIIDTFDTNKKYGYDKISCKAAKYCNKRTVCELYKRGLIDGVNAVLTAITNNYVELLQSLSKCGMPMTQFIYMAVRDADIDIIAHIHASLAPYQLALLKTDPNVIATAAGRADIGAAEWLLRAGYAMSVNCLKTAAKHCNYAMVALLLSAGCPTVGVDVRADDSRIMVSWSDATGDWVHILHAHSI